MNKSNEIKIKIKTVQRNQDWNEFYVLKDKNEARTSCIYSKVINKSQV